MVRISSPINSSFYNVHWIFLLNPSTDENTKILPALRSASHTVQYIGYAFQCRVCDEDFYRFEVLTTRRISLVRKLRRIEREYERSSKKEMRKRSFTK